MAPCENHPSWGVFQRRKYPRSQAVFKDQQPPGHRCTCTFSFRNRISPLLSQSFQWYLPLPLSFPPSLLSFLPFFLFLLIFPRQFSPSLSSVGFYPNSDMGCRNTEQMIFPLKSISARRFLHGFSAKPAWAANPLVDQITSMLKAAFELSEYSSQGQRLNYPLQ